jgi:hypothetical protein
MINVIIASLITFNISDTEVKIKHLFNNYNYDNKNYYYN